MTELSNAAFRLRLSPEHGGSVDGLSWHGEDLLLPTRTPAGGPTDRASFPLVPFAGRIVEARFTFGGRSFTLAPNFLPEPNVIHGFGWHAQWQVSGQSETDITLVHECNNPDWPSSYTAQQTFRLGARAMELDMSVTNTGSSAMPAGLGWHPYFPVDGAEIRSHVSAIWKPENAAATPQPEALSDTDNLNTAQKVSGLSLDHCFTSTTAETLLHWPDRKLQIKMTASDIFGHLVVYTPDGTPYFCAEPISHVPDAVNLQNPPEQTGLRVLEPGQTLNGKIWLEPSRTG